jgi:predicted O-linked N-acetylglucosamine transferase (SPINDLY family)
MLWRLLRELFSGRAPRSLADATERAEHLIKEGQQAAGRGDLRGAVENYRNAVECAPAYSAAHFRLGMALAGLGDGEGAIRSFRAALALDPANPYANHNLGNLLYRRGELGESERCLRRAIELKPDFPEACAALAETLRKLWKLAEAETALRRAIEIDPGFLPSYRILGEALRSQSRIEEAVEVLAAGRKRDHGGFDLESAELFALNFSERISPEELFARHKAFGARLEAAYRPAFEPFRNARDPDRRLRVAYVSGDFSFHPVSLFLIPVLERHDRSAYEVYCYSVADKVDDVTRQIAERADVWRQLGSRPAAELAETINRDRIDVLIDLSGHTGIPSLGVFALRPAPVQATWLGYMNTTGLTRIGYRLCDACTDPPGEAERLHTEIPLRLPHAQWCYRPSLSVEPAPEPPVKRNGFVTFGSFNQVSKLSPATHKLWAEILRRLPDSRLVVASVPEGYAKDSLLRALGDAGVPPGRVRFLPYVAFDEYFRRFNDADIALDSMPYSGCSTTVDTLWMGVPVITLPGATSVSRSTASILSVLGLTEWIASSPDEYVRRAVRLAQDPPALYGLPLRERMRASPLMDEVRFTRELEAAFRGMWRAWCSNPAPAQGSSP